MTCFMLSRQPWVSNFIFPLMLTQEFYFSLFPAWYAYKLWLQDLCWRDTHKGHRTGKRKVNLVPECPTLVGLGGVYATPP